MSFKNGNFLVKIGEGGKLNSPADDAIMAERPNKRHDDGDDDRMDASPASVWMSGRRIDAFVSWSARFPSFFLSLYLVSANKDEAKSASL